MTTNKRLVGLINYAKGSLSNNKFAHLCGISPGNLSKILNIDNYQKPTPSTLKKIADNAQNDVTYEQLMTAAGYLSDNELMNSLDIEKLTARDRKSLEEKMDEIKTDLIENPSSYMFEDGSQLSEEAIKIFLNAVEYGLGMAKLENKKYTPKKYKKN